MMNGSVQKTLVVVVAVVVIVGAAAYIVKTQRASDGGGRLPEELISFELGAPAFYVCDDCGQETTSTQRPTPFACPKCGKQAMVESVRYQCTACGKTFEARRQRTIMSKDGKRPVGLEMKTEDGKWDRATKLAPKCPGCGNADPAKLKPVVPGMGM